MFPDSSAIACSMRLWREAIALVAEGVCDAKTVDDVVKSSFGARLAVLGPLENADLVGTRTDAFDPFLCPACARPLDDALALSRRADLGGPARLQDGSGVSANGRPKQQAALRAKVTRHLKASFGAPSRRSRRWRKPDRTRSSSPAQSPAAFIRRRCRTRCPITPDDIAAQSIAAAEAGRVDPASACPGSEGRPADA